MMLNDTTFADAVRLAAHYVAIGQTTIYLHDHQSGAPWEMVTEVEAGGSYRLNGPASVRLSAYHPCGLTFKWIVDFEGRDANGKGVSLFDRPALRDLAMKLPKPAREQFAAFLQTEVMPGLQKSTAEIRKALNNQIDSEDVVRGLIAFARGDE